MASFDKHLVFPLADLAHIHNADTWHFYLTCEGIDLSREYWTWRDIETFSLHVYQEGRVRCVGSIPTGAVSSGRGACVVG